MGRALRALPRHARPRASARPSRRRWRRRRRGAGASSTWLASGASALAMAMIMLLWIAPGLPPHGPPDPLRPSPAR